MVSSRSLERRRRAIRRSASALILITAMVVGLVPTASAALGGFTDPKDATRLDLATVSLRHHSGTHRYKWRFTTYERFRLRNGGSFLLFVDSVGAGRWDYGLHFWYDSGHEGVIFDRLIRPGVGGADRFTTTGGGLNPRSAFCTFKGIRRTKPIRWRVETVREQVKPFGDPLDSAPDIGWF
jgi:hypothetical protein